MPLGIAISLGSGCRLEICRWGACSASALGGGSTRYPEAETQPLAESPYRGMGLPERAPEEKTAGLDRRHRPLRRDAGALAVAEPEPGDAGVGPHRERLAGGASVRVGRATAGARARAGSSASASPSAARRPCGPGVSHVAGACGSSSIRYELARSSRSDSGATDERVEQPAVAVVAGELDHVHAAVELGQALEVVVGLGVDVDDQRAAALGLEGEQLGGDRLARPERAGEQDRRRPPRPRRLGDVEAHRPRAAGQRAADVDAARPSRPGGCRSASARRTARSSARRRSRAPCRRPRAAGDRGTAPAAARAGGAARPSRSGARAPRRAARARSAEGAPTASEIAHVQQRRALVRLQVGVELARELRGSPRPRRTAARAWTAAARRRRRRRRRSAGARA